MYVILYLIFSLGHWQEGEIRCSLQVCGCDEPLRGWRRVLTIGPTPWPTPSHCGQHAYHLILCSSATHTRYRCHLLVGLLSCEAPAHMYMYIGRGSQYQPNYWPVCLHSTLVEKETGIYQNQFLLLVCVCPLIIHFPFLFPIPVHLLLRLCHPHLKKVMCFVLFFTTITFGKRSIYTCICRVRMDQLERMPSPSLLDTHTVIC